MIVTCPNCHRRYDPGADEGLNDLPENMSLKVVCPACGQWLRLPEREAIDPPNAPPDVLREMSAQSRLVDDDPPRDHPRPRDREGEDRGRPVRRLPRDMDDDDDDTPRRSRRNRDSEEDDYEERPRRRHYDDDRDDYDDYPRRKPSDGLGIASMVIGISSCVFALTGFCCVFTGALGVLGGILAVILGFVARSQTRIATGPAKTGIITGFVSIALALLMAAVFVFLQFGGLGP